MSRSLLPEGTDVQGYVKRPGVFYSHRDTSVPLGRRDLLENLPESRKVI